MSGIASIDHYLYFVLARQEHDHTDRLNQIKVPTLVLVGDDENHGATDTTHWAAAHKLAGAIPGAKLVVLSRRRTSLSGDQSGSGAQSDQRIYSIGNYWYGQR